MSLLCTIFGHRYKRETCLIKKCSRCGGYVKQNLFDEDEEIGKAEKLSNKEAEEQIKYDQENVVSLMEARLEIWKKYRI